MYWLARCEGFQLECADGTTGVVEQVLLDGADTEARALVVRVGRMFHRSVVVPADHVEAVAPFEEVLVGSGLPASRARTIAPAAGRLVGVAGRATLLVLRRLVVLLWLATIAVVSAARRAAVRSAPHVARGTRATASWSWSAGKYGGRAGKSGARFGLAWMRRTWSRLSTVRTEMNRHAPATAADAPTRPRPAGRTRRRPQRQTPP